MFSQDARHPRPSLWTFPSPGRRINPFLLWGSHTNFHCLLLNYSKCYTTSGQDWRLAHVCSLQAHGRPSKALFAELMNSYPSAQPSPKPTPDTASQLLCSVACVGTWNLSAPTQKGRKWPESAVFELLSTLAGTSLPWSGADDPGPHSVLTLAPLANTDLPALWTLGHPVCPCMFGALRFHLGTSGKAGPCPRVLPPG